MMGILISDDTKLGLILFCPVFCEINFKKFFKTCDNRYIFLNFQKQITYSIYTFISAEGKKV